MLIACWSPKGGSGTTTVAVALAVLWARATAPGAGAVLADLGGDGPAVLGLADPEGPGLADWFAAGPDVGVEAIARLEVVLGEGLGLLPAGAEAHGRAPMAAAGPAPPGRVESFVDGLAGGARPVVVDCGPAGHPLGTAVAAHAPVSLVVLHPCYLAVRRALTAAARPTGAVLVVDEGRSLGPADVADVLGVPVVAEVPADPAVARAVDAGLLAKRLPRSLARALRGVVAEAPGRPAAGSPTERPLPGTVSPEGRRR